MSLMIKLILLFIFIVLIVLTSLDFFCITPPNKKSNTVLEEQHSTSLPKMNVHSRGKSALSSLLKHHKFDDALALYLENSTDADKTLIESYLVTLTKENPILALKYMQKFIDSVPTSSLWNHMISTFIKQGEYKKAITFIMQAKENYISDVEDKRLEAQLNDVAISYMEALHKRKDFITLIHFLDEMISYNSEESMYKFRLAKLNIELKKTNEATALLEELKYDDIYAQKSKDLLENMDNENEYKYAIALQRYGSHYTVNVWLDGHVFKLLLDTGASYIFIDEDKAPSFEVIQDNIPLSTAGGDIVAKLCKVSNLRVGDVALSNMMVTIAPFDSQGMDGLLGMNFFEKFTFFIDQKEDILYLNPR